MSPSGRPKMTAPRLVRVSMGVFNGVQYYGAGIARNTTNMYKKRYICMCYDIIPLFIESGHVIQHPYLFFIFFLNNADSMIFSLLWDD